MKKVIAAFTRRSQESFGESLLIAINHAKDWAQREVDLEWMLRPATGVVPTFQQGLNRQDIRNANGDRIKVKTVRTALLRRSDGSEVPIPIISRQDYLNRVARIAGQQRRLDDQNCSLTAHGINIQLISFGEQYYLVPASETAFGAASNIPIGFDVIEWIPDFTDDNQTHWLFDYAKDFMMFRSIVELNFLLKEDQRFNVSFSLLDNTWKNVKQWNSTFIGNTVEDPTLD